MIVLHLRDIDKIFLVSSCAVFHEWYDCVEDNGSYFCLFKTVKAIKPGLEISCP